jgi:hypothetical protein
MPQKRQNNQVSLKSPKRSMLIKIIYLRFNNYF